MSVHWKIAIIIAAFGACGAGFAAAQCGTGAEPPAAKAIGPADFVELRSDGCFGACPIYTVRLQADGTVTWNGGRGGVTKGQAVRHVASAPARAILERYLAAGFARLCNSGLKTEDAAKIAITLHIGQWEKTVEGEPDWDIYRAVGEVAGAYYWLRGDPQNERFEIVMPYDSPFGPKPGMTALMRAAQVGDASPVDSILQSGAAVNARDSSGYTALVWAALAWRADALKKLLASGADPNIRSNEGQTALMAAATRTDESVIRLLIDSGAQRSCAISMDTQRRIWQLPRSCKLIWICELSGPSKFRIRPLVSPDWSPGARSCRRLLNYCVRPEDTRLQSRSIRVYRATASCTGTGVSQLN